MDKETEKIMDHLVMWATGNLDSKYQKTISEMSGFKIGLFNIVNKNHLFRETAFLNLYLIHNVCEKYNVASETVNYVFNITHQLKFKNEDIDTWFKDLMKRIDEYTESANSGKNAVFMISGLFLIKLHTLTKTMPGFDNQTILSEHILKITESIINSVTGNNEAS